MEDFRGYGHENNIVVFRPGVNLVLGDNATGKSSIVALILFNLLHRKVDVARFEDYRTLEPRDLGAYKAGLTLIGTDGNEYTIEKAWVGTQVRVRVYRGGEELKKAGELELTRPGEAQTFMLDCFGATPEVLEEILVQVQDPAKLLWPVGEPREVGKKLSRLLKFEPLQSIYTNAVSCERMLREQEHETSQDIARIKHQIKELSLLSPRKYENMQKRLERELGVAQDEISDVEKQLQKQEKERMETSKELQRFERRQGSLERLEQDLGKLEDQVKGKSKPRVSADKLELRKGNLDKLLKSIRGALRNVSRDIGGFETALSEAKEEIEELRGQIESGSQEYNKTVSELKKRGIDAEFTTPKQADTFRKRKEAERDRLTERVGGLKTIEETESQYVDILSRAEANCPVCDSSLTEKQRNNFVERKTKLIEETKAKIRQSSEEATEDRKIIVLLEALGNQIKALSQLVDRRAKAEQRLKLANKQLPALHNKHDQAEIKEARLENQISVVEDRIRVAKNFEEIETCKDEIVKLRKEVSILPKLRRRIVKLDKEVSRIQRQLRKSEGRAGEFGPKIESVKQNLQNAKVWYGNLADAKKRYTVTKAFGDEIGIASKAAKTALHDLFANYSSIISFNLGWIWPILYPRPDLRAVQLEVTIEETEEKGEKTLITSIQLVRQGSNGESIPFNTISSHGQRVLASIAFRVAFLNLLSKTSVPKVLVLDEPTIWIDNANRERLGQFLAKLVREVKEGGIKLDQVIVISHDPAFLNAIDPEGVKHVCKKNEQGFCEVAGAEIL